MMTTYRYRRGVIGALAAGVIAGVLVLGSLPASASQAAKPAPKPAPDIHVSPAVTAWIHQKDTPMGAEIRAHEKVTGAAPLAPYVTQTPGLDVSGYQGNVDWSSVAANGAKFAYIKATEGTDYTNPYFAQQYDGSYNAGIIRGSYHFAHPDASDGATQADYFIAHGGGWSKDGMTLPGALDIEWNPSGDACYNMAGSPMVNWILSFSNEYHAREGVWPVIYTATSWWSQCTGNQGDFSSTNPLWLANYNGSPGPMPYNWGYQTFWQFADSGTFPGDQDYFNGPYSGVQALADG